MDACLNASLCEQSPTVTCSWLTREVTLVSNHLAGGRRMNLWKCVQVCWRKLAVTTHPASASRFVDLAPTAEADNADIYFEALDYAINRHDVLNIALTGPYGSGKSSVIKSFLSKHPKLRALQLSLASFSAEVNSTDKTLTKREIAENKQEVERSILQQILYVLETDKLPFSRFKRIQVPKRAAIVNSFFITIGLVCVWYLFNKQADLLSGSFFKPFDASNWINYLSVSLAVLFALKIIHVVYTTSFGLSLKSLSLKDVQIAPAATSEESILNRHLDEILYFFQSTDYDIVIIEDLDRFENPDIFVTLREINGLINANEAIKRRVRFLYALRDDIFANTDRTKFFEFIVPVVPIINHSNSIDKVLEQGQRVDLHTRLNTQFIREVSRYLTDLRLIRNIFNEYVVYSVNLKAHGEGLLDPNKLLAVLIYKNVIPKDFAALHRQEGTLSRILARYEDYVSKIEGDIRAEVSKIETDLKIGDAQMLRDQSELRKVYAMEIIRRIPHGHAHLRTSNGNIKLNDLPESEALETLIAQKTAITGHGSQIDLSDLEDSLDPFRSFIQRRTDIDRKSSAFKQSSEKRLRELKAQLASLRTRRFNEVVRESAELIEKVFAEVGENRDLLKYLILEGYLDDTYYQYISLFHAGRLSPNDNNFLVQIRGYTNPAPDYQLDNIAEVIASMREQDFGHHFVLNRHIFDYLLMDLGGNSKRLSDAANFIATHFQECGPFFRSYYAKGSKVENLTRTLMSIWPGFTSVALSEPEGAPHAARILAYAPDQMLKNTSVAESLRSFLSDHLRQVLVEDVRFDYDRLRTLALEIGDVGSLEDFPEVLSFIGQEGLYRISSENIRNIVRLVISWKDLVNLERRNFSTLKEINDPSLLKRIDANFRAYLSDVLLALPENTEEEATVVIEVLNRDDVELELRAEFLKKQTVTFSSFDDIPAAFHRSVLEEKQIEISWENCVGFMGSEQYDQNLLTAYLRDKEIAAVLSRRPVPSDDASIGIRRFLVGNNAFELQIYQSYVRQLPRYFTYIPEVDANKIKILIEERKIDFTPQNFENLQNVELKVLFIAANFTAYEAKKGDYAFGDEFRANLLQSGITDAQKLKLIGDMDQSYIAGTASVAADVSSIFDRNPIDSPDYSAEFIKAVILNSRDIKVQISLLNKLHSALSVPDVREVLRRLPGSYQDIATFARSPKIENNDMNQQLAAWLKDRNIISSFGNTLLGVEIRIHTFKKEP